MIPTFLKPFVRSIAYHGLTPQPWNLPLLRLAFDAHWTSREAYEWARRTLVATPMFLSKCASHGSDISIDKIPYVTNCPRIELGSNIRVSGELIIKGNGSRAGVLKIGSGVFIANKTSFVVAERIEVGDYVSIGAGTYIADTEGHSNYNPQRPIWEVPATDDDIGPVIIEDNVQISRTCMILKGVRIGARSIIGAGSVVRTNIPPDSVVMGNPARVVRRIQPLDAATQPLAPAS